MKIVFAQGNPGRQYEQTRHNTGFLMIDMFAEHHGGQWRPVEKFNAAIAEITVEGEKILLVKPMSFYNDTGPVARKLLDFYKLAPADDLLVLHDELALPLGSVRVRGSGSDAGNNGIKSLNTHVGDRFQRLRIGTWSEHRNEINDVDYVLGKYSAAERALLNDVYPHVEGLIEQFIAGSLESQSLTIDK